jgi:sulfatase modifying factor 1
MGADMRAALLRLSLVLSLAMGWSASAVTMDWTPIGNPGNACDPQQDAGAGAGCFGSVGYAYNIGTYEVTIAQYVEFLNAKAASDPLGLYNTAMASGLAGIARSGSPGSFTYSAVGGGGAYPVRNISFYDALRFTNWMQNGQGSGDTETGSYTLLGGTATPSNGTTVTRNADAIFAVPTEDEWYKAAYYDATSASYFRFPVGSNTVTCSSASALPNRASCAIITGGGSLTFYSPVGSYPGSPSPYGTFDQGGNVGEWNETTGIGMFRPECASNPGACRGIRGGSGQEYVGVLDAIWRDHRNATSSSFAEGFRLIMIPEPGTGLLVIAGLLGLAGWRRAGA